MKKNIALRLGAVVLVMSVITLSLVSGTFAKYTKGYAGNQETVTAAQFNFTLSDDADTEYLATEDFDIFHYTDNAVYEGGGDAELVAPGTTGSLPLYVSYVSEVDFSLDISLDQEQNNVNKIPIYYTLDIDGVEGTVRYSDDITGDYADGLPYQTLAALETAMGKSERILANERAITTEKEYLLHWHWAFDTELDENDLTDYGGTSNDAYDTTIGQAGTATVALSITVTATQLDNAA